MKVIRIIFLVFFLVSANVFVAYSEEPSPPDPTGKNASVTADGPIEGGIDFPINQNLVFLMMAGLVLGTLFIYRNKTKKASV